MVTYGTASAPLLAIRCLHELAIKNQEKYPTACKIIKNNFYVDDLVCGAQSPEELIQLQKVISSILQGAGFQLRKWLTNQATLYEKFAINRDLKCSVLVFGDKETNKTLGLAWNANSDKINFIIANQKQNFHTTKRSILSEVAKIFDPLGLLGPVIIVGKLLIQALWKEKVNWDDEVSESLAEKWKQFKINIPEINKIEIPRCIILPAATKIELHGFGDASQKAYGAAIFLVSKNNQTVCSNLLCSQNRVAPLKQQSLPRLELCAAVLLAQLADKVIKGIDINIDQCFFWTDSTITLSWIRACPSKLKTFVANRVSEIQRLTHRKDWYHISSTDNPADILSRGCTAQELQNCELWWNGPKWIIEQNYPNSTASEAPEEAFLETRKILCVNSQIIEFNIISKFSTLTKLNRVVAYCFRFFNNCKKLKSARKIGELDVDEIKRALIILIGCEQKKGLSEEFKTLKKDNSLKSNNPLCSLNPFIDSEGIIRVGGRLNDSFYSFNKRHPIILPKNSKLTNLIFEHFHVKYFHCGPTQLLAVVREYYWPIGGKQLAKKVFQKCVVCFLAKPKNLKYQMGNLPVHRVTQSLPFFVVGIDYAGPFHLKDRFTRNPKLIKAYVCLFVCFSTKAVHLEAVSDLTTACFLDALKRFMSRRGKPAHIYSDNAKTFIGANSEIKEVHKFLSTNQNIIHNFLAEEQVQWHFIPPRAPHFGGIWEAGVKSVKYHMKRVMKDFKFNFEQFHTILCQIEGILNSRPICPLPSPCDNPEALTPGHFLLLRPPMSIPTSIDVKHLTQDKPITQFKHIQQILFHFWIRWKREYISELQRRGKWKKKEDLSKFTIQPGDVVILKEESTPVMRWPLARVMDVHPGRDGVIRVVTVKFDNTIKKRPITKLCKLPNQD